MLCLLHQLVIKKVSLSTWFCSKKLW